MKNKGGRPRLPDPLVVLTVRVPVAIYEAVYTRATRKGLSVSAYVRSTLRAVLRALV